METLEKGIIKLNEIIIIYISFLMGRRIGSELCVRLNNSAATAPHRNHFSQASMPPRKGVSLFTVCILMHTFIKWLSCNALARWKNFQFYANF